MTSMLSRGGRALRQRLRERPDTEHEQALVRLAVGVFLFFYLLPKALTETTASRGVDYQFLAAMIAFLVISLGIFVSILLSARISPLRRLLSITLDIGTVTFFMSQTDVHGLPMFLIYIWVTLANGFRFGPKYLVYSLALSICGFLVVLRLSPFWAANADTAAVLIFGMLALSLYVLSLVKRMFDALNREEAANLAKRRFISVVSHEMRTPLNAIIGMGDLLREGQLNREQADMAQTMGTASRMLLRLVEDVLDFSKIEAGKLTIEETPFDLHALLNSTCRILQAQAQAKGLELRVTVMPEVPHALAGDPHHLRQILVNLVGNAIKFTERGNVTVHVSLLSEQDNGVRVKFSVRDSGIGIAPEAQQQIFDSFTQADQSTTRRFGGTGLGTTIAKQLVELMGGQIGLESAEGLGSTFWFELTLQKQPESDTFAAGKSELSGARIMLVGFPLPDRESIGQTLQGWGAMAVVPASLDEAVQRLIADIGMSRPFHSVLVWADNVRSADLAAGSLQRSAGAPLILCIPPGADPALVAGLSGAKSTFTSMLRMPVQTRLLFNVLHSISAVEEADSPAGVVQLRDYLQRRSQDRQYRIIVADDSATNRQVIGKILERGGHAVTLVDDGEAVLDALETAEFDLAVLDRNMPGMGGIEALEAIRVMQRDGGRLPVIILSADVTPETRTECSDAGADAFISKPVEAIRLLDMVAELCGKPASERRHLGPVLQKEATSSAESLNLETLQLLEGLGSQSGFLERLVKVFISDNVQLLEKMERTVTSRDFPEFRRLLHAMKGSAASIGADRLAQSCSTLNGRSDAEIGLQFKPMVSTIRQEFERVREGLDRYVTERRRTTG
jgi:two-component system sensor histidine kinase RpfC